MIRMASALAVPLSRDEFSTWQPEFIVQSKVTPEGLEGYELWKKHRGGFFGK
jgi:hypothetical protein